MPQQKKQKKFLPGFGLTLGYSVFYLSIMLFIPISIVFFRAFSGGITNFIEIITQERVLESYKLSLTTSLIAAVINTFFGFLIAWVIVRYNFFGKKIIDALIDLPFALPTAVAGISLTTLLSHNGILGRYLESMGIKVVFTSVGIVIALIFISLPFVVRTVQPVLEDFDKEVEEAALSLNAKRSQIFFKLIFPEIRPAIFTGFTLAFARSLGEYGSVVFISGNMPMKTEIAPLLIMTKLEQFDYVGATAIGSGMLIISFILLAIINYIQFKNQKRKFS